MFFVLCCSVTLCYIMLQLVLLGVAVVVVVLVSVLDFSWFAVLCNAMLSSVMLCYDMFDFVMLS